MKQLNEFSTLAEAQAYSYVEERMVSPDMVLAILTEFDSTLTLDSHSYTNPKAKGFMMALQGPVTEFNVMNSHPVGQKQQAILSYLVSIGAVTQDFADNLIGHANQTKRPYLNTTQEEFDAAQGEEFPLNPTTEQATYQLNFTTNPTGQAKVNIMARWGESGDLTEWETIKSFSNVRYKQGNERGEPYTATIQATNSLVRELKVVSDQVIGMTVTEL